MKKKIPPLEEAQNMISTFMENDNAELDVKRLSQLIEVVQQEIERNKQNARKSNHSKI